MSVQLLLSFQNDALYRAAIGTLSGMGVEIRRTSDLLHTVAVTGPDSLVPSVRALAGIAA